MLYKSVFLCSKYVDSELHIICHGYFRRVDEFSEYGDLDMMMQYVKDVQTVQRKLADCTDSITFINEVMNVDD
jgi:hypothetical protein